MLSSLTHVCGVFFLHSYLYILRIMTLTYKFIYKQISYIKIC